jgi:anti-sigma regulatory factor (Ser/Thr protein kinase)
MEVATSGVMVLPYKASSVGVARRCLVADLGEAGVADTTVCDAGLVLSELISNALRHASPLPGSTLEVSWTLHSDSVEVAVSDGGGGDMPRVNEPGNCSVGGRGLSIVDRLSLQWGVCGGRDKAEKKVWAEVPVLYGGAPELVTVSSRDA